MAFERFTDRARKVMYLASAEAARRGDDLADTVDLLVGMLRVEGGVAGHVLALDSVDVDLVLGARDAVRDVPDVSLADVESRSLTEVARLNHNYVGTEHLLLAVCYLSNSRGARLLVELGKRDQGVALAYHVAAFQAFRHAKTRLGVLNFRPERAKRDSPGHSPWEARCR